MAQKDTFPLGTTEKAPSTLSDTFDNLLGQEYDEADGKAWRLVRLDLTAGITSPGARVFAYKDPTAAGAAKWDVVMADSGSGTKSINRPAGVSHEDLEDLDDNDYFMIQIAGDCECVDSDDGNAITKGDFVETDDDTDLGKVKTNTSTITDKTIGIALDSSNSTDDKFTVRIKGRLNG